MYNTVSNRTRCLLIPELNIGATTSEVEFKGAQHPVCSEAGVKFKRSHGPAFANLK